MGGQIKAVLMDLKKNLNISYQLKKAPCSILITDDVYEIF